MALGAEEAVHGRVALVREAQLLEVKPGENIQAAEGAAQVPGAGFADHVQGVDAAGSGEDGGTLDSADLETTDALQLSCRDVDKLGHADRSSKARAEWGSAAHDGLAQASTGKAGAETTGNVASPVETRYSA